MEFDKYLCENLFEFDDKEKLLLEINSNGSFEDIVLNEKTKIKVLLV